MRNTHEIDSSIDLARQGFSAIDVADALKKNALKHMSTWLTKPDYSEYVDQIIYLIENQKFSLLLDSFYQVLPFGTGGRRGSVGIGPNRMNAWTVQSSAQGHAEYLKKHATQGKQLSVVLAYDVREYTNTEIYSAELPNPVKNITSKDLAIAAAQVYAANNIDFYLFDEIRSTPELSFAIRFLNADAGDMFTASHNPKDDNGKKIYGADGGQLMAPVDQEIADIINGVQEIKKISSEETLQKNKLNKTLQQELDEAYIKQVQSIGIDGTLPRADIKIIYSPLHGVGNTSVLPVLKAQNFSVIPDKKTSEPNGSFPNITFNIPNPELHEAFDTLKEQGMIEHADLLITSDPDADRVGIMARNPHDTPTPYRYFTGNEIAILATHFLLEDGIKRGKISNDGFIVKTCVTTELMSKIAEHFKIEIRGEFPVGFKYISNEVKKLEPTHEEHRFIFGAEESHGYLIGSYTRDKDAAGISLVLCELAAKLKTEEKTLGDYLDAIYKQFGFYKSTQFSLIFKGAEGKGKIDTICAHFRKEKPTQIGPYFVEKYLDMWEQSPVISDTDKSSRNIQIFYLRKNDSADLIKVTVRPSGTEPKAKIYVEVGGQPLGENAADAELLEQNNAIKLLNNKILNAFTQFAHEIVGVHFPERVFKLSALLPVETKEYYFEFEKNIIALAQTNQTHPLTQPELQEKIADMLAPFGKDPIDKIRRAFYTKTGIKLTSFIKENFGIEM